MNRFNAAKKAAYAAMLVFAGAASASAADPFPSKPIHIVVAAAAGGGLDITSRLMAQKMQEYLHQSVVVENRAGAETMLGTRYVKESAPDGYTILAQANGFSVLPALKIDPGFDPLKDFTGIGLMVKAPMVTEVPNTAPEKNLADIIARARAQPGQLTYGTGGAGTPQQLSSAAFHLKAGLKMTEVAYKGAGPTLIDVAGGRLNMTNDMYVSSSPYIKSGTIRPIAVTSEHRMAPLPDVPTYKEQGVDVVFYLWLGLVAPAGTPKEVVQKLSDALHYATSDKDIVARFSAEGSELGHESPDEFNAFLRKDVADGAKTIAALKLEKQ
jgi:tripartite-type tricarboxylate transporter receptor subunit TctC